MTYLNSKDFNKQQTAYIRLAYWAIYICNLDKKFPNIEAEMKQFVYFFILDLGISPFVKCYTGKTLMHSCINANRVDFLTELLSHNYECYDEKDYNKFVKSFSAKDDRGNGIFHEVF